MLTHRATYALARRQLLTDVLGDGAYRLAGVSEEEDVELVGVATSPEEVEVGDLFVCLKARVLAWTLCGHASREVAETDAPRVRRVPPRRLWLSARRLLLLVPTPCCWTTRPALMTRCAWWWRACTLPVLVV